METSGREDGERQSGGPAVEDGPHSEPSTGPLERVGLNPNDPVLARTQAKLKKQLVESKLRLEDELRERTKLFRDAQQSREQTGVKLFNFQQQLARLQMDLEKAHDNHSHIAALKEQAQGRVSQLKESHQQDVKLVKGERVRADKCQEELDRCVATLCSQACQRHTSMCTRHIDTVRCMQAGGHAAPD